jgi:hypothetical protein
MFREGVRGSTFPTILKKFFNLLEFFEEKSNKNPQNPPSFFGQYKHFSTPPKNFGYAPVCCKCCGYVKMKICSKLSD